MFLHRNRSGRVWPFKRHRADGHIASASRPAPLGGGPPPEESPFFEPIHDVRGIKEEEEVVDICTPVKDLRARRVFTPSSLPMECSPDWSPEVAGAGKPCVSDRMDSVERDDGMAVVIPKADSSPDAANVMGKVPEKVGVMEDMAQVGVDKMFPTAGGSEEQGIEGTSPEVRRFSESEETTAGFAKDGSDMPSQQSGRYADEGFLHRQKKWSDQRHSRPGIFPCSRMKLVRDPNSFSYRRLLPFLMGLTKSTSSSLEALPCQNRTIKTEKPMVDKSTQPLSSSPHQAKMALSGKTSKDSDVIGHIRGVPDTLKQPVNKTHKLLFGNFDDIIHDTAPKSSSACILDARSSPQFNAHELEVICMSSSNPPPTGGVLFIEGTFDIKRPSNLPRQTEAASGMVVNGCIEHSTQASQIGAAGPTRGKHPPSGNGILKRQREGCIGLCMCLNCSSFRLHAERALEFSRKQMLEAEDVATGLINELSCLRKLVEKHYAIGMGVTSNSIHQHGQVKGMCRKASTAEELARKFLREMNNDLNAHRRIIRPRVTFLESIED